MFVSLRVSFLYICICIYNHILIAFVAMGMDGTTTQDGAVHAVEKATGDALHLTRSTTELMAAKGREQNRLDDEKKKGDNMEKKRRQSVMMMPFSAGSSHLFTPTLVESDENRDNTQQNNANTNSKSNRRQSVAEGIYDNMTSLSDVHMQMDYYGVINKDPVVPQETILPKDTLTAESVYGVSR